MVDRELDGMRLVISRTGYTGELGYELYLMRRQPRRAQAVGRAHRGRRSRMASRRSDPCHIRRIEGGILAHGCDMTIEENPYEVGYGYKWMVELEQEQDFIGRDALRAVAERGVDRKLVGVEIGGAQARRLQRRLDARLLPGPFRRREIGRVTSACYSPRLDENIGYAMVPVEHGEIGTELDIERPEETVARWWPTGSSSSRTRPNSTCPPAQAKKAEVDALRRAAPSHRQRR